MQRSWGDNLAPYALYWADSCTVYTQWPSPMVIVSDGAYGHKGFDGDPDRHHDLPAWYEPHVRAWSAAPFPCTTLSFGNTERGWASVHPLLKSYGGNYRGTNIWDKGKEHIAGNIHTNPLRQFPIVTEICLQYVFRASINVRDVGSWLRREWLRTGLPLHEANRGCGVQDAATRKHFCANADWDWIPSVRFEALAQDANTYGDPQHRPYGTRAGRTSLTGKQWQQMRPPFHGPIGMPNVWSRPPLRPPERLVENRQDCHPNQNPLDLMTRIILASSHRGDGIWEPLGGVFSVAVAAHTSGRHAYASEINPRFYANGVRRFAPPVHNPTNTIGLLLISRNRTHPQHTDVVHCRTKP